MTCKVYFRESLYVCAESLYVRAESLYVCAESYLNHITYIKSK